MQHPSAHTHGTNLTKQPNRHRPKRGERRSHAIRERDGSDRRRRQPISQPCFTVKVLCKEDKQPDRSTRSHGIHMFTVKIVHSQDFT